MSQMSSKTNIGYSMRGSESYRKGARERGGSIIALGQFHHSSICEPSDSALTITLDPSLKCQNKSHGTSDHKDVTRIHEYTDNCRMIEQGRGNTTSIPIGYDSHRLSLRRVELTEFMRKIPGDSSSRPSQQRRSWIPRTELKEMFYSHLKSEMSGTQDATGEIQSKVADVRRKLETEPILDNWEEGCPSGDEKVHEVRR
ncbi:hypothetical protein V865_004913 [Kwoniella europaea PYCC6329]|uniref:Uncharacterized protein n=1 Tax=Kwoniella europaea PYCC6329 TaxID=1423913 RepID=A0AAX4KNE2_9TREE